MGILRTLLIAPSRWRRCHAPTQAERVAQYELRLGQHRAALALRKATTAQVFDLATARSVRPKIAPRLPADIQPAESVGTAPPDLKAPIPLPRATRGTDDVASPRYRFDDVPIEALPDWHPDSLRYAGP